MSVSRTHDQFKLSDDSVVHYEIEKMDDVVVSTTLYVQHNHTFTDAGNGALDAFESLLCSLLFSKVYLQRENVRAGINAAWDGIVDRYKKR